ncbi:hypothetical protein ANN_24361 [Periplaneta americana]|uniref:Uncharacterized protein n=1 Tax=Periplaneta americana TaxID=6978 RepID=A0ABQ8S379_PERAM|nr:hypothetical protein ANN_24361 [Periplaneta americana]
MLAGSEFQSLGRAIVKEDEYEEVRWGIVVAYSSQVPDDGAFSLYRGYSSTIRDIRLSMSMYFHFFLINTRFTTTTLENNESQWQKVISSASTGKEVTQALLTPEVTQGKFNSITERVQRYPTRRRQAPREVIKKRASPSDRGHYYQPGKSARPHSNSAKREPPTRQRAANHLNNTLGGTSSQVRQTQEHVQNGGKKITKYTCTTGEPTEQRQ